MPELNGLSAWVSIGGVDATEYNVEVNAETKTVTCWIASEVGQEFVVKWKKTSFKAKTNLNGQLYIDNHSCGGKIFRQDNVDPSSVMRHVGVTQKDGKKTRSFRFSALETTDDDSVSLQGVSDNLGVIELRILPVGGIKQKSRSSADVKSLPNLTVHERSKKAITQQVLLGEAMARTKAKSPFVSTAQPTGPPLAILRFLYRPLDVLRANGIAPRPLKRKASAELDDSGPARSRRRVSKSATLDPEEEQDHIAADVDDTTLSDDEDEKALQALQAQMKTLEARRAARKGVKKEEVPVKIKKAAAAGTKKKGKPAVIDLTLD
ncbi:hypothetical protein MKEN_01491300 [Mycena kentingensis (nom. inval.)]|nr:hypothetical protein MKEN_01491300 [Mycena kentingensis (nom. inval.)]